MPGLWRGRRLAADPEFVAAVLEAGERGHELALHGLHHRAVPGQGPLWRRGVARVLARGAAEFATLPQPEATARLREGLEELAALGVTPIGFHPPGRLISPDGVRALRSCGLRYYSTHLAVHTIPAQESADVSARIAAPALSHRPGGFGERFGVRLMTGAARRYARTGRAFRIALHPDDLAHAGLREAPLRAIDDAVELELRRLAINAPVRFHGHVADRAALAEHLAAADVVLAPCLVETFGLAVLEALACATPVVAAAGGAAGELLGEAAGLVAPPTAAGMAEAVLSLLARPEPQRRAAARGRAELHPWSRAVAEMLAVHTAVSLAAARRRSDRALIGA